MTTTKYWIRGFLGYATEGVDDEQVISEVGGYWILKHCREKH
jgi:hypothetical protein